MPVEQDSAQPQFGSTNNIAKAPQVLFPQKTRHLSQDMSYNVNSAESLINGLDKDCRDTICGRMVNIAKNVVSGNELSIPFYGRDGNCESDGIDNDDAFIIDNNDDINNNNNNHNGSAKQDIMSVEAARFEVLHPTAASCLIFIEMLEKNREKQVKRFTTSKMLAGFIFENVCVTN